MRARAVALALVAAVLLAACAGNGEEPDAGPDTGERVLTVLLADDWVTAPAVVTAIQDFEREHPGVRVDARGLQFGQLEEEVRGDLGGPRDIDVSQWHAFAAGASGYAQPVEDLFAETFPDDWFVPGAIDDVSWGDHLYGVPLDVNAVVMIVNTTALEAAGHTLDDLATWDGTIAVAESIAAEGLRFTHVPSSSWTTYGWIRANGAELFDLAGDGTPTFTLDSPGMVETFDYFARLVEDERYAFHPTANDVSRDGFTLFHDGEVATVTTGSWHIAELLERPPGFDWAVIPMPAGPSTDEPHTVLGGSSLYVTRAADDRELAFEFAAHLVKPEYSLQYAMDDGRLPPQFSVLEDPFFDDPRYAEVVKVLPVADAMRIISFPTVTEVYTDAISDVLNGRLDAATALAEAQERANEVVVDDLARAETQGAGG